MTSKMVDYLFGALPTSYCSLFFYISVFAFVQLFVLVGSYVYSLLKDNKLSSNPMFHVGGILMLTTYTIMYFQSRMFYSMCLHSLNA